MRQLGLSHWDGILECHRRYQDSSVDNILLNAKMACNQYDMLHRPFMIFQLVHAYLRTQLSVVVDGQNQDTFCCVEYNDGYSPSE